MCNLLRWICFLHVNSNAVKEKLNQSLNLIEDVLWRGLLVVSSKSRAMHFSQILPMEEGIKRWMTLSLRHVGRSLWGWLTPDRTTVTDSSCLPRAFSDWLSQKQFPASCSCLLAGSLNVRLTGRCLHTYSYQYLHTTKSNVSTFIQLGRNNSFCHKLRSHIMSFHYLSWKKLISIPFWRASSWCLQCFPFHQVFFYLANHRINFYVSHSKQTNQTPLRVEPFFSPSVAPSFFQNRSMLIAVVLKSDVFRADLFVISHL